MMKRTIIFLSVAFVTFAAAAQESVRTAFMSYGNGENAVTFDPAKSEYYISLNGDWGAGMTVPGYFAEKSPEALAGLNPPALPTENKVGRYERQIEIPMLWLDRDIFLRIEGLKGGLTLFVNGKSVGTADETGTAVEFNIRPYIEAGTNTITMEIAQWSAADWLQNGSLDHAGIEGSVYVYSQYYIHIQDFTTETSLENTDGVLDLAIEIANKFNFPDTVVVYYDLRDAQGNVVRYNTRETIVPGLDGRDTVRFQGVVANVKTWSPESPYLYQLVMRVRYKGRFTEYVPFKVGFRDKDKPLVIKEKRVDFNGLAPDDRTMRAELSAIKKEGYNAIRCGYHPRKTRLYELCDEIGLMICDEANIDTALTGESMAVGGTLANDPAWVDAYIRRAENAWRASRNYTGTVLYSLGKGPGIGYNIYRSYLNLKRLEPVRPVTYTPAGDLWPNDKY